MRLNGRSRILGACLLVMAGGCHLIVGIRDAEPYGPDAGIGGGAGEGGGSACGPSQTRDCYSGAEQTAGIGACRSGTQTCNADETWGTCEGEVLPAQEDCFEPDDEDCSGYACGETMWVRQFGAPSTVATSKDTAVDPRTGDIYLTGKFHGQFAIGQFTLDSQGEAYVAFLAKFDRLGTPLWAKQFGKVNGSILEETLAASVAVDGQGNVVLVGRSSPGVNLGGGDLSEGLFFGKFTPSGQHIWSQGCQSDYIVEVATVGGLGTVDPASDDVIIAGSFNNSVDGMTCGDMTILSTSMGGRDIFVARFAASNGSVILAKKFGGPVRRTLRMSRWMCRAALS